MVNVLRLLLSWGVDRGWRKDNPALRPGRLKTGPGYQPWTAEAFAQFMAHPDVGEPMKRAAALGYYTGQRKGDCLAMAKTARAGGTLDVLQAKTGARLCLPEPPELTDILDAAPATAACGGRVGSARLATGPVLNMRVRPRRVPLLAAKTIRD
jgi:hypothetical protein